MELNDYSRVVRPAGLNVSRSVFKSVQDCRHINTCHTYRDYQTWGWQHRTRIYAVTWGHSVPCPTLTCPRSSVDSSRRISGDSGRAAASWRVRNRNVVCAGSLEISETWASCCSKFQGRTSVNIWSLNFDLNRICQAYLMHCFRGIWRAVATVVDFARLVRRTFLHRVWRTRHWHVGTAVVELASRSVQVDRGRSIPWLLLDLWLSRTHRRRRLIPRHLSYRTGCARLEKLR